MEYFSLSPNGKYMALRGSSRKGGGVINILDTRTLQWATQVRIESRGGVADFAWWGNGNGMSIAVPLAPRSLRSVAAVDAMTG